MRRSLLYSLFGHAALVGAVVQLTIERPAPRPGCALQISPPAETPAADAMLDAPEPPRPETPEESWPCEAATEETETVAATAEPPPLQRRRAIRMYRLPVPLKLPGARTQETEPAPPTTPVASATPPFQPVRTGPTHAPRLLVKGGTIRYPAAARRRGWTGRVLLRLLVDERGCVTKVEVKLSSGHASLDEAAMEAAWKWRFEAARTSGEPVAAWLTRAVVFRLEP